MAEDDQENHHEKDAQTQLIQWHLLLLGCVGEEWERYDMNG